MLAWLQSNYGTILICAALAAVVAAIARHMIVGKKQGKGASCGCGCKNCAMQGLCHKE